LSVYLDRAGSRESPVEVLTFSCDGPILRPYVLDTKIGVAVFAPPETPQNDWHGRLNHQSPLP
jgi:hypothetical protein